MLRKGFFFAPKGKKTAISPRLNTTMQVENHNIETKTGLVRNITVNKKLTSRKRLFNAVATLTTYGYFDDRKTSLQFMTEGLEKRHQLIAYLK